MNDSRDIGYAVLFFGVGVWGFFAGFKRLRRKRLIENIPTSTVRGLALGLVELQGQAQRAKVIKAPLSGSDCVFYRYTVERYQKRGKSSHWVTIAQGDSCYCPFLINDQTGSIIVLPRGAEFVLSIRYEFANGIGRPLPENLIAFLEASGLGYRGFLGSNSLRFREWYIVPEEEVYVLGTAKKIYDKLQGYQQKLAGRLNQLLKNPDKMAEVDENKDGQISIEEWDKAVNKVEGHLLAEEVKTSSFGESVDVVIAEADSAAVYIISNHSQKELTRKFGLQAFAGVFGGTAVAVAMLVYLLLRLARK